MNRAFVKYRLRPVAIAVALLTIAAAGHVFIITKYTQGRETSDSISINVEDILLTMERFKPIDELEIELEIAKTELEKAISSVPSSQGNTFAIDDLVELAENAALEVLEVESHTGSKETAGENAYNLVSIQLQVRGTLQGLLKFLKGIESGSVQATRVDELSVFDMAPAVSNSLVETQGVKNIIGQALLSANIRISMLTRI